MEPILPVISPFDVEMRREVWCLLSIMDTSIVAQSGLPRIINSSQSNIAEPRNLLNEDLQDDMLELPSSKPDTAQTAIQYFVAKNRFITKYGEIFDLKSMRQPPQYADIMKLDNQLHSAYDSIPQALNMRPMAQSIIDSPTVILQRIHLALTYYKATCTLHRLYLIPGKTNQRFSYSHTACLEAALKML